MRDHPLHEVGVVDGRLGAVEDDFPAREEHARPSDREILNLVLGYMFDIQPNLTIPMAPLS